jgi:hypothetical protein
VSVSGFDTVIVFPGQNVHTQQFAVNASLGHQISPRLGWNVTDSWLTGGNIGGRALLYGEGLGVSLDYLAVYERAWQPFLALSASASASDARAVADDGRLRDWTAGDLRLGAMGGKTFGPLVPYAAVRVFGGPVSWHLSGASVIGTDHDHYTAGLGLTLRLPRSADVTVEVMPVGERSAIAGLTLHR